MDNFFIKPQTSRNVNGVLHLPRSTLLQFHRILVDSKVKDDRKWIFIGNPLKSNFHPNLMVSRSIVRVIERVPWQEFVEATFKGKHIPWRQSFTENSLYK